jgi:hypothetical protein
MDYDVNRLLNKIILASPVLMIKMYNRSFPYPPYVMITFLSYGFALEALHCMYGSTLMLKMGADGSRDSGV